MENNKINRSYIKENLDTKLRKKGKIDLENGELQAESKDTPADTNVQITGYPLPDFKKLLGCG